MKKLLAVSVTAVLLCTLLVTNVFALTTAPSIPSGISAITPAGYLLDGEVGNQAVKYATNLPLGEIKDNIKAAPSPNKTKKAAPVKEEITEGFAFMGEGILEMFSFEELLLLTVQYDFSEALMFPLEFAITEHEKDTVLTLNEEEILIYLPPEEVQGHVVCNYTGAPVDITLTAGTYSLRCAFDIALDDENAADVFVYSTFESFVILNTLYVAYELGNGMIGVEFSVLFPDDYDAFVVYLIQYPPAE